MSRAPTYRNGNRNFLFFKKENYSYFGKCKNGASDFFFMDDNALIV